MPATRREFLKKAGIGLSALSMASWLSCGKDRRRPNFLFILSDDHACQAISLYGSPLIRTPNIDRIGREGLVFHNAFVCNSICAPSRATILTGKYSHTHGLRDNRDRFDASQTTFPQLLQQAGYQTLLVGKWHLKTRPQGFDRWMILPGQGAYYNPDFITPEGRIHTEGYVTDKITEAALEFLKTRDPNRPFCLLVHHKAPHRNWMPALHHLSVFENEEIPPPPTFFDDYTTRCRAAREADMRVADLYFSFDLKLPREAYGKETGTGGKASFDAEGAWYSVYARFTRQQKEVWDAHYRPVAETFKRMNPQGKKLALWKYQQYMKDYLRCVLAIDESVGQLLKELDSQGLTENTVVIYTSDQGFFLGEHGWYDKRFMYEESLSFPLLIRYPQLISPGSARNELVQNLDLAPTILDLAGVEPPADIQGRTLRPLLVSRTPQPEWREAIYYHYYEYPHGWHNVRPHFGIRTRRYKLIHFYGDIDCWELYDLQEDPHELRNLFREKRHSPLVKELMQQLRELQMAVADTDALKLWEFQ
jgi:arylsulfatase A-like enzyme